MATDGLYPAEVIGETGQVVEQLALLNHSPAIPFRSLLPSGTKCAKIH